jgi:hypothetical protein
MAHFIWASRYMDALGCAFRAKAPFALSMLPKLHDAVMASHIYGDAYHIPIKLRHGGTSVALMGDTLGRMRPRECERSYGV